MYGKHTNPKLYSLEKIQKRVSLRKRIKLVSRVTVFLLCISGLIYLTAELFAHYLRGRTVVNIRIEQMQFNKIPSVTICYPRFVSMEKMAKLYPDLGFIYKNYKNIMNSLQDKDYSNRTLKDFFYGIYWKNFTNMFEQNGPPVYELFDKMSFSINLPKNSRVHEGYRNSELAIRAEARGNILKNTESLEELTVKDFFPVESLILPEWEHGKKCFTFFSQLNKRWKNLKINLDELRILVEHSENWFPTSIYDHDTLYFAIHSSNTIPTQFNNKNFFRLFAGYLYEMTFSKIETILLPPNYSTNCRVYDSNDTNHEKLRSDCLINCVNQNLRSKCSSCDSKAMTNETNKNCSVCVYRSEALLRKEMFNEYKTRKLCPKINFENLNEEQNCLLKNRHEFSMKCETKCQNECNNQFFNYEVMSKTQTMGSKWDKRTIINIKHNQLPDQVIEHLPEKTLISLIANFGGLFGIWFGLFVVIDSILRTI